MITEESIIELLKTHNLHVDTKEIELTKVVRVKFPNNYTLKIKRDDGGHHFNAQINNKSGIEVSWFNINKELLERAINYVNTSSGLIPKTSVQKRDGYKLSRTVVSVVVSFVALSSIAFLGVGILIGQSFQPQINQTKSDK
jgi:hypothetical protein